MYIYLLRHISYTVHYARFPAECLAKEGGSEKSAGKEDFLVPPAHVVLSQFDLSSRFSV